MISWSYICLGVQGYEDKMRLISQSCALFLWMHTLTLVRSQDCTREQFFRGALYDSNFDTTALEESYPDGKQVRVGCKVGYSGFFKLICNKGEWDSRGQQCEPKSCGHPGDAQFADFELKKGDDFVFGSEVVFTCQKGYQMVSRRNYRHCMAGGWDGTVPVCEAQQCQAITVADNVHVIGDPYESTYGNVVRFTCKLSHEILNGSAEMYCDENGEWSGQVPKCIEIECPPPTIEHGYVQGNIQKYKEHDVLHFRCNARYKPVDPRPSMCSKRGITAEWSPTPACEPIKCRLPLPAEGTSYEPSSINVFVPGKTVEVRCGRKFGISENFDSTAVTICKEDGKWSPRPVCLEITCRSRRPQNVYYWNVRWGQVIRMDETVSYSCNTGYKKPDGVTEATCTRNGWEPDIFCREITCNRQDYQNSNIDGNDQNVFKYRDRVIYNCKTGYEGRFALTCEKTGWVGSEQCRKVCKKLHIDDAQLVQNEKETYGLQEQAYYRCKDSAQPRFSVTCEQSGWTGVKNCSGCLTAHVSNGFIVGPHGDTVYYTCNEGYKLSTEGWWAKAKCTDGVWSGLKQCIANTTCKDIPDIPHGKVIRQRGLSKDARITCDDGYHTDVHRLTCHEGEWLPPKAICTPTADTCKPPRKVDNAVIVDPYQKEYLSDSTVTYRCRDKFVLLEPEDRIRCKDGQWEEKNIMCTPYCDQLKDDLMTFTADKERYVEGDVIKYQCVISGVEGNATCNNHEWNKSEDCKAPTHSDDDSDRVQEK
ncbi:complement factor H-like isoform X2 [Clinocottus analis]|uniref:complement factor H-like isoform X2 n=1 Tax=Clinocottus analis TaxID=304258 RepID=UPI0035BF24BB